MFGMELPVMGEIGGAGQCSNSLSSCVFLLALVELFNNCSPFLVFYDYKNLKFRIYFFEGLFIFCWPCLVSVKVVKC